MSKAKRYVRWLHHNWPNLDQLAWIAAIKTGDVLFGSGPAAGLAPRTIENSELAFGRYLEFLSRTGRQGSVDRVGDRLRLDDLRAFALELGASVASQTVLLIFASLSRAVRVMDPQADRVVLSKIIRRLARLSKPVREIDSRLITPVDLIKESVQMMAEAEACPIQGKKSSVLYRNGAFIMGGALCALRRENWRMIIIGKHLQFEGDEARLSYESHEMKGRRTFEFTLPPELTAALKRYISYFRPRLLKPGEPDPGFLFVSWYGQQMFGGTLSYSVKSALFKRTGKAFSPHMFRYAAATFVADQAPENMTIAKGLLHHRRFKTTSQYYIRGQRRRAMTKYQEAVSRLVKKAKSARKKPSRRRRKSAG